MLCHTFNELIMRHATFSAIAWFHVWFRKCQPKRFQLRATLGTTPKGRQCAIQWNGCAAAVQWNSWHLELVRQFCQCFWCQSVSKADWPLAAICKVIRYWWCTKPRLVSVRCRKAGNHKFQCFSSIFRFNLGKFRVRPVGIYMTLTWHGVIWDAQVLQVVQGRSLTRWLCMSGTSRDFSLLDTVYIEFTATPLRSRGPLLPRLATHYRRR